MNRAAQIRRRIAELGPRRRGARIPEDLRRGIASYGRVRRREGVSLDALAKELGVSSETVRRYVQVRPRLPELVPVEVLADGMDAPRALVMVSPRGYHVEGLDLEEMARLLRMLD